VAHSQIEPRDQKLKKYGEEEQRKEKGWREPNTGESSLQHSLQGLRGRQLECCEILLSFEVRGESIDRQFLFIPVLVSNELLSLCGSESLCLCQW